MDAETIADLLKTLTPKEEKIIRMRYGIGCERVHTYPEIAEEFDASPDKIKMATQRAKQRLKTRGLTEADLKSYPPMRVRLRGAQELATFDVGQDQIEVESAVARLIAEKNVSREDLLRLLPRQFEELVAEVWSKLGYDVELTARTRDGGRDVIAVRMAEAGVRYLIECKRYNPENKVGVHFVRALYGVKVDDKATKAFLATTSSFTKDAMAFFDCHQWELEPRDYKGVIGWLDLARHYNCDKQTGLYTPKKS